MLIQLSRAVINIPRITILSGLLAVCLMISPYPVEADLETQRQTFQQASRALELNQVKKFKQLLIEIEDYPIQP